MIIGLNCADAELYSYKLLDNTGKGNVDDLKSAFDWCLMNNIRLVNLSFGTTHFKDKGIIRQLVNQYANKGLIIIAATANSGYTAFPASFSNVIGVKAKIHLTLMRKVCGIKVWILQLHRNTKSGLEETI